MNCKYALVALVAVTSSMNFSTAQAQIKIGKYQQKIVGGAAQGAATGYATTRTWQGTVVGAGVGAVEADRQHNQDRDRARLDRSQPVGWQRFDYSNGVFIRNGNVWIEYQNGRPSYQFQEISRNSNSIDLFDASRKITVRLAPGQALILLPGRPWQFLYSGSNR